MKIAIPMKMVLDCGVALIINEAKTKVEQKDQSPVWIVNPADRGAVEMALDIKRALREVTILVVNFGQEMGNAAVHYALARGADRGVLIESHGYDDQDAPFVAKVIAKFLSRERPDLVLCGKASSDSGMGCVGPFIAEYMGMPQITGVVHLEISENGSKAVAQRRIGKGNRQVIESPLPAVVSVDPMLRDFPYVSVNAAQLASRREIQRLPLDMLDMEDEQDGKTRILKIEPPRPRTKRTAAPESSLSPMERVKFVMRGGMDKKKEGRIHTGTPETLAHEIFKALHEKGLIG